MNLLLCTLFYISLKTDGFCFNVLFVGIVGLHESIWLDGLVAVE